ncbi:DUF3073 domain-containing protein [Dactylosporangium sp. CA-139114]|uniref:DUF3073 domain-containing protein n=1 Tax=Dactylosporangium sp. CA-139114 TaxID=3239931 RepID=UPI003D979896
MGRGRAKAKQTKIARELKYFSMPTDFAALEHELSGEPHSAAQPAEDSGEWSDEDDLAGRRQ